MQSSFLLSLLQIFVAGPAVVYLLLRTTPTISVVRNLGFGVLACLVMAIAVALADVGSAMVSGFLLWCTWVVSMAATGQVLRLLAGIGRGFATWLAAIGAALPWFGILVARMMAA